MIIDHNFNCDVLWLVHISLKEFRKIRNDSERFSITRNGWTLQKWTNNTRGVAIERASEARSLD